MTNRRREWPNFKPRDEVISILPDIEGNEINGLGEKAVRRPTHILWHNPQEIAHGNLQQWFFTNGMIPGAQEHMRVNREFTNKPLPPMADEKPDWTAAEWTKNVKRAALELEADQVGIAELNQDWVFDGQESPFKWVVVLAMAMDYEHLKTAPSENSQIEVQNQYARGTRAAYNLAGWMREHGCDGQPHGGPMAGPIAIIPAAIDAGLGELGKHGSMINREFGSSFRLACVLTNMPLLPDQRDIFGADDFCTNCQICTSVCPTDAIYENKQWVRGEQKWYVDFDDCILYFVENKGCGLCIGQCPWSRTGIAQPLAEKMTRRRERSDG